MVWGILGTMATGGSPGNLLDDDTCNCFYDVAKRLVQCAAAAHVSETLPMTCAYDGDEHRLASTEDGETTSYIVAVQGMSQVW